RMALTPEELESQIALQDRLNESIARNVELKRQLNETTETQSEVQANFFAAFEEGSEKTTKAASSQEDLAGALDEVANKQKDVGDSTSFMDKAMMFLNKTVMSAKAGFRSLMGVLKPLYSFITLNPVFEILGNNLQNVSAAQTGAFEAAQQFKETLGTLPATIDKFNKFVEASARTIAKTGRSLSSIAGIEYGDITKKFLGYASEMGIGFDHFVDHAKNAAGEIILFKEGLQMSIDTLEDLTFRFGEDSFGDFAKQIVGGSD
ncbi:MAG TPA: hypothetical protein DD671_12320, partial [Balneolaceae bacterium]|nr:hypothetical protein [Balneolaceae bacterium]